MKYIEGSCIIFTKKNETILLCYINIIYLKKLSYMDDISSISSIFLGIDFNGITLKYNLEFISVKSKRRKLILELIFFVTLTCANNIFS